MDPVDKEIFEKLLKFMTNYVYSREDYETTVNKNGPTSSKRP